MIVEIFKNPMFKACSLNGISEHHDKLTLVNVPGFRVQWPSPAMEEMSLREAPAAMLDSHVSGIVRVVPAVRSGDRWIVAPGQWSNGGAFVHTSDSRFLDAVTALVGFRFYGAVALHDRNMRNEKRSY